MGRLVEEGNREVRRGVWNRRLAAAQEEAKANGTTLLEALGLPPPYRWQPWSGSGSQVPAAAPATGASARGANLLDGLKSFGEGLLGAEVGELANASAENWGEFALGALGGALGGISDGAWYAAQSKIPQPGPAFISSGSRGGSLPPVMLNQRQSTIAKILASVGSRGRGAALIR